MHKVQERGVCQKVTLYRKRGDSGEGRCQKSQNGGDVLGVQPLNGKVYNLIRLYTLLEGTPGGLNRWGRPPSTSYQGPPPLGCFFKDPL